MGNYQGWTAGQHWQQAMADLDWANEVTDAVESAASSQQAVVHLAAARLLLDHPPVDVLDAYPVELGVEPPEDWRRG